MRVLGELVIVALGNHADSRADVVALNGVVAEVHHRDLRNVLLDEGFDGADGEVDGVYDAEGFGRWSMTVSDSNVKLYSWGPGKLEQRSGNCREYDLRALAAKFGTGNDLRRSGGIRSLAPLCSALHRSMAHLDGLDHPDSSAG